MAVAAYAAVVSLMHVLDQIQQYPPPRLLYLDRYRIETLHEKVSFLQDFLEVHSRRFYAGIEGLARQIADVAVEAEDIIDAYVVDQITISQRFADETDIDLSFPGEGIDNVIEKMDSIKEELMMIKEPMTNQELVTGVAGQPRSSTPPSSDNKTMVGFDKCLVQIIEELVDYRSDLKVLPIVGMGGIGKTTLARNAFDNSHIMGHFHVRLWITVSQEYSIRGILQGLLHGNGELSHMRKTERSDDSLAYLGEKLYKSLYGRRYLIVMDDVWSTEVWIDTRLFFPENNNGSRIIVTTRLLYVASSFGSMNPYLVNFLDEDQSWDLLCRNAFPKDGHCPPELEEIGKYIAKCCKGLPLAIVITGGLLSNSKMTREYWEFVAKNVNSFVNSGDDDHCFRILSLSYDHLPIHLKPCFLYMKEFSDEIKVSELIRIWVAEGFLKPIKDKTLEKVAKEYLEDLIGRNLILRCQTRTNGKVKTCGIHDLLRDLCIRESHKEHFYCVPKVQKIIGYETTCFLCSSEEALTRIDLPRLVLPLQQTSIASCLVCLVCRMKYPQLKRLRLVKVLDPNDGQFFDGDILHPTRVRYLYIDRDFKFVGNLIHLLWNLQTLIIGGSVFKPVVLPSEIWKLPQLKHLSSGQVILPNPPLVTKVDRKDSTIILTKLQTLCNIINFRWSEDAIERLPNLKILGIDYEGVPDNKRVIEWPHYSLHNLGHLHKLESLCLVTKAPLPLKNIALPLALKKLNLWGCNIPWEEMTIIGSLPNLEVFKLYVNACKGPEWNPVEGEFLQLKKLEIQASDLVHWRAENDHFPRLECLKLVHMRYLEEIPPSIGEIPILRLISLDYCTDSVVNSAKEILEEQYCFGNEDLQLYIDGELVVPGSG